MTPEQQELEEAYGYWGEHPLYPLSYWKYAVANDDTRMGYWPWVEAKIEEED